MISRILILFLCVLLSACSSNQVKPWNSHQYTLVGLVGVTASSVQQSANFTWTVSDPNYKLELYGPLGIDASYLEGDDQSSKLTLANGKSYEANDAEGLMDQILGWSIPVEGLNHWLLGKAEPESPASVTRNDQQQVIRLSQDGWQINYTWGVNKYVPTKMILTRANPNVRVVIVINKVK